MSGEARPDASRLFHREVGGRRLRFRTLGEPEDGPTVVFLHHGLGSIESWKALPLLLRRRAGIHAVIYERWGYGDSEARECFSADFMEAEVPDLLEVIASTGADQAHLVGHSDGGSIALLAAADRPRSIRSVVSIAAHTFVEPLTTSSIRALLTGAEQEGAPGWLTRFHGERAMPLLRAWAAVWLSAEHSSWDIRSCLAAIHAPLFAIQGDADEFGTGDQLEALATGVPHATTWTLPGVGHTPFVDEAEFSRRVEEFWKGCERPGDSA